MNGHRFAFATAIGTATLVLAGVVGAQTVIQPAPPPPVIVKPTPPPAVIVEPTPPSTTVIRPAPPTAATAPAMQVVQAGDIKATDVRAQTIYANKIKASTVNGTIHQTKDVKVNVKDDGKVP